MRQRSLLRTYKKLTQPTLWAEDGKLCLWCKYEDRARAVSVTGSYYSKKKKCWTFPLLKLVYNEVVAVFPEVDIEAGTKEGLDELRDEYVDLLKLRDESLLNPDEDYRDMLFYEFWTHQLQSFTFWCQTNFAADFSEPGSGKTAVQIGLMWYRIHTANVRRILIVCPLSIIDRVWVKDIKLFTGGNLHIPVLSLGKSIDYARQVLELNDSGIYIINYEKTWRLLPQLVKWNPDFIIADESSRIKNPTSKQTKAMLKLSTLAEYKSILTGTPTPNTWLELFAQWKFLDPRMLGESFYAFRELYFAKTPWNEYEWNAKPSTATRLEQIKSVYSVSWKKKDTQDLPPFTSQQIECELSKPQKTAYNEMASDMLTVIDDEAYDASIVLTKLLRLSQITSGFIQNTDTTSKVSFTPNPKLKLLIETIGDLPPDAKFIVWAVYHEDIRIIAEAFDKAKISHVEFYGGVPKGKREEALTSFIDGDTRAFIAHPKSAGMGLNLSVASYSFRFSMNYSFEDYAQSVERFNRSGQKNPMNEYILVCKKTVDEIIAGVIEGKKGINALMTSFKEKYSRVK
jgi:SNF2 family DNA or RNA helicase